MSGRFVPPARFADALLLAVVAAGELTAGKDNGKLFAVDQKRLTAVMRGLGTGELKHPRFTKEEAASSGEVVHERLWNYILSLESPEVYFGGSESIHGVSREHDPQGSGWLGCLRRMATRYGCDPKETIGTGHRFFDRGAEKFVYATMIPARISRRRRGRSPTTTSTWSMTSNLAATPSSTQQRER